MGGLHPRRGHAAEDADCDWAGENRIPASYDKESMRTCGQQEGAMRVLVLQPAK